MIRFLAWFLIVTEVLTMAFYPCYWGKARSPSHYGAQSWAAEVISATLLIPICGRILGWW